jgi:hypothetical protein
MLFRIQQRTHPMPSPKPYRAAGGGVTMESHGMFTIDMPVHERSTSTRSSIYMDSMEPSFTHARHRQRSRSPLRSARSKTCTMRASPDVAPSPLHRPSGDAARGPRKLRATEPNNGTEIKQTRELEEQQRDLLQELNLAMESGYVVLVDSFEESDWRAHEGTTISTVAPKTTTRWTALGKLVTFVCASFRPGRPSSSRTLRSSTSSKTQCRV